MLLLAHVGDGHGRARGAYVNRGNGSARRPLVTVLLHTLALHCIVVVSLECRVRKEEIFGDLFSSTGCQMIFIKWLSEVSKAYISGGFALNNLHTVSAAANNSS